MVRTGAVWGLVVVALAMTAQAGAHADGHAVVDITGNWHVEIDWTRRCTWVGQVRLDQIEGRLSGNGEAAARSARRFCPRLQGDVEGSVSGSQVEFGFATGRLGTGAFEGELAPGGRLLTGTWTAGRAAGIWRAERVN